MLLYNLGAVPWVHSQTIYHALARLGREALVLVSPDRPYACVGFHQDILQELDMAHVRANNLPMFRREVGGGGVYLDCAQIFWQVVLKPDNPLVPRNRQRFYKKFLGPVIRACRAMGIEADFRADNDVVVGHRKISGTGAGEVGRSVAFVGNILREFDFQAMCRVLKAPDEGFRQRVRRAMEANLTTMARELGEDEAARWDDAKVRGLLAREFGELVGGLTPAEPDAELLCEMDRLAMHMLSPSYIRYPRKPHPGRAVKIRAGTFVRRNLVPSATGLLCATFQADQGRFLDIDLELPAALGPEGETIAAGLARALEGRPCEDLPGIIQTLWDQGKLGALRAVTSDDWLALFKN